MAKLLGITARSAPPAIGDSRAGGKKRLPDFARRECQDRRRKKERRKNEETVNGKGNEEIFALSRACHAVPREKIFPLFLPSSFSFDTLFIFLSSL